MFIIHQSEKRITDRGSYIMQNQVLTFTLTLPKMKNYVIVIVSDRKITAKYKIAEVEIK